MKEGYRELGFCFYALIFPFETKEFFMCNDTLKWKHHISSFLPICNERPLAVGSFKNWGDFILHQKAFFSNKLSEMFLSHDFKSKLRIDIYIERER